MSQEVPPTKTIDAVIANAKPPPASSPEGAEVVELLERGKPISAHELGRGDLCYCKAHNRQWDTPAARLRGLCSTCTKRIWMPFNPEEDDGVRLSREDFDALVEKLKRPEVEEGDVPGPVPPPWEPLPFIRDAEGFVSVKLQQGDGPRNGIQLSELVELVRGYAHREMSGPSARKLKAAVGHLKTAADIVRAVELRRRTR